MNTEKETKKILNDEVANIILTDESLREYQLELISIIIGINKEILKNDFELITPRINENVNHKYSTVDAIFENHAIIVNIEVNLIKNEETFTKFSRYLCQLLLKQIKKGKKDKIKKHIYQINLNDFDLYKKGELLYESILMEKKYSIERPYNKETIYDINIDYLRNVKYDTIKKKGIV